MDDCGGGYSESIAEMCDELSAGSPPLLIITPNGRGEAGANRDCHLLNPAARSQQYRHLFTFLGACRGDQGGVVGLVTLGHGCVW